MKTYDVNCPCCGYRNKALYLEETEGWMECEKCGSITMDAEALKGKKIPVYLFNNRTMEFDTKPVMATVSC